MYHGSFAHGDGVVSSRDRSTQLTRIVQRAIEEHQFTKFARFWELYERTTDIQRIDAFYIRTEVLISNGGGYCNVAIIGDGLLIDIEGDDNNSTGNLTFQTLKSVGEVEIHTSPLQGLHSSQGASLVVLTNSVEGDIGVHWVAKTEDDEEHLLQFAQTLVQAISKDTS